MTPAQLDAWLTIGIERSRREYATQLTLNSLAAQGKSEAIDKQVKALEE